MDTQTYQAKEGSRQEQPHTQTTLQIAKQIIRSNYKVEWLNEFCLNTWLRPKANDEIDKLSRKRPSNYFQTQNTAYIFESARKQNWSNCGESMPVVCNHPEEIVEHHLFHCRKPSDLRVQLLPLMPDIHNLREQLFSWMPDIHNTLFCKHTTQKHMQHTFTCHWVQGQKPMNWWLDKKNKK